MGHEGFLGAEHSWFLSRTNRIYVPGSGRMSMHVVQFVCTEAGVHEFCSLLLSPYVLTHPPLNFISLQQQFRCFTTIRKNTTGVQIEFRVQLEYMWSTTRIHSKVIKTLLTIKKQRVHVEYN